MKKKPFLISPKYLPLIAGIVWMVAGINILKIGFTDFIRNWHGHVKYAFGIIFVFAIFTYFIFYPLVKKHRLRVLKIVEEKVYAYRFFDMKGYLVMIFMITGGFLIRSLKILPGISIGVLYSGIGLSLICAGALMIKGTRPV
ncbi:MAG: hypothetical protein ACOX4U_08700 [Anaerovoracaceae bacterium]|jgi:hypothetical protein